MSWNGKEYESLITKHGKMSEYMKYLKEQHGYTIRKMEYWNSQFPILGGRGNSDEGFGNMEEHGDDEDNEESDEKHETEIADLKEHLMKADKVVIEEEVAAETASKKLKFVEKVTSQKIVECLDSPNFEEE